jgi:hypothetical protein
MIKDATSEKESIPLHPATDDLSKEIEQSMDRQSDERIKVVRVFDDCYRCNWWVADKHPQAFWLSSGTISRSRFVRAKKTRDGLLVEDVT